MRVYLRNTDPYISFRIDLEVRKNLAMLHYGGILSISDSETNWVENDYKTSGLAANAGILFADNTANNWVNLEFSQLFQVDKVVIG